MWRTAIVIVLGAALCLGGQVSTAADDKGAEKPEIKGGIEGKVKKVDADKDTLTITTSQGRERTFTIKDDTIIVGPRGGKVRRHLKDPRFHEGFSVTVVAEGNVATEVHLGFAREPGEETAEPTKTAKKEERPASKTQEPEPAKPSKKPTPPAKQTEAAAKASAKHQEAKKLEEEDDEQEIPGHVKSFDPAKRILVVSLLNGKNRTFILAKDVPVRVKGAASKQGLNDPAMKAGAAVTVITDEGGRKVQELRVVPASEAKRKKAG